MAQISFLSSSPPSSRLEVEHFHLWYGTQLAIRDIQLTIPDRQVTALIGPSGCGKTTLLVAMNRIAELRATIHTKGRVLLDGRSIYDGGLDVSTLRRRVGMVFQRPNPFPKSIFDNVTYGLTLTGERQRAELLRAAEASLTRAALWEEVKDRLHRSALTLSGGQQQRLCIARALAVGPEVLLLDEPTSALDPISTLEIEDLVRHLATEITVVIVTHNLQQASRVSDHTGFLLAGADGAGELVEFGPTRQVFSEPADHRTENYLTGRFG